MAKLTSIHIPAGYVANLTTDAVSSGTYTRIEAGGTRYTPTAIAASSNINVGPFNEPRDYLLTALAGNIVLASNTLGGVFTAADEAGLFVASEEANVAELDNDADGTEIATAVNGILAILIANGLMAAPE